MSEPQNFRSAFNGFNRDDVVKYLEYINSRHHAQINQLTGENDYLRQQLEAAQAAAGAGAAAPPPVRHAGGVAEPAPSPSHFLRR